MRNFLKETLLTKTFQDSLVTFSGTFFNAFLGIIFFILLARNLGPFQYGVFSVVVSVLTLLSDIGDLGVNTGLLHFIGKYITHGKEEAYKYIKLGFIFKFFVWVVIILLGYLLAPFIATNFFVKAELIYPLELAFLGAGGLLLFSFVANCLQAMQQYFKWSYLNIFSNGLRLIILLVLIYLSLLNTNLAIWLYILIPFIAFIIGLFLLPNEIWQAKGKSKVVNGFLKYNRWVALSIIISALGARVDTFLSTRLLSLEQVGVYSVALQLTYIIPQFIYALASVVAPKLASFDSPLKAFEYLKKLQLFVLGLSGLALLAIPISYFVIPLFYGPKFYQSLIPFTILFLSQLVFFISIPTHQSIYYYFSKPNIFLVFSIFQLIITSFLAWILISKFGIVGAALTVLIGNLYNFFVPGIWVLNEFRLIFSQEMN